MLDALQLHGVNGLSWQILQCKEVLGGRNEHSVYTEDRTQRGLFQGRSLESLQPAGSYGMTNVCLQNLTSSCIFIYFVIISSMLCHPHGCSSRSPLYLVSAYQMLNCAILMT